MVAAQYGRPELLGMLLDAGADPRVLDSSGKAALHHAARAAQKECLAQLLQVYPSPPPPPIPLRTAPPRECPGTVRPASLRQGASTSSTRKSKSAPNAACRSRKRAVISAVSRRPRMACVPPPLPSRSA